MNSKKKSLSAHIIDVDTLHVKYLVKRTIILEYSGILSFCTRKNLREYLF